MAAWNPNNLGSLAKYTRVVKPVPRLVSIQQVKSAAKAGDKIAQTLKALQLTKMHKTVVHKNISPIRGMINTVRAQKKKVHIFG